MTTEPLLLSTLTDTDDEQHQRDDSEQQRQPTHLKTKRRRDLDLELELEYDDTASTRRRRVRHFLCHPQAIFTLSIATLLIFACLWIHRTPRLQSVSPTTSANSISSSSASSIPSISSIPNTIPSASSTSSVSSISSASASPSLPSDPTRHFFVFGDSYSKTAFDSEGRLPSTANPLGNPSLWDVGKYTTSGGPNWATLLTTRHNTTLALLYNYAFGGATINKRVIPPPHNIKIHDFTDQVSLFKDMLTRPGAPSLDARKEAVFAVWFGQNDVDQVYNRTIRHPNATVDRALDSYIGNVIELWNEGAREFLFVGVSPIENSPLIAAEPDSERVVQLAAMFNERVQERVEGFAQTREGLRVHYYDPAPAFHRIIESPKAYGLKNATCIYHDGVSCPWWDHFHPGVRIHEQVAADIADLDIPLFAPLDPEPETETPQ